MQRILIVEDTELNIEILKNALLEDYAISVAKNGAMALKIMQKVIPDIILLDIMMPVMDGYETITELKKIDAYKDIPVIFLTAQTELHEKTKGFQLGAVDYITKPFEVGEVRSRVETHLALSNSKKEIQELLSKTVVGSTKLLLEILSISNATAYGLSFKIRKMVSVLLANIAIEDKWKIEIASMLSLIGTFDIPSDILKDIINNKVVDKSYQNKYREHPEIGYRLISAIPRFSDIAIIIRDQNTRFKNSSFDTQDVIGCGIKILKVATDYQLALMLGKDSNVILREMMKNTSVYNINVLNILIETLEKKEIKNLAKVNILKLNKNMILEENIVNKEGKIVVSKGSNVTDLIIDHLKLLRELGSIKEDVHVSIVE